MSESGDGQPPKLHIVKDPKDTMPRKADGKRIDKAKVKEMFMASPHYDYASFARSNGWDVSTRVQFPAKTWIEEKKKLLIDEASQEVEGKIFKHKVTHHRDVLATLERFPKLFDKMMTLLEVDLNNLIKEANQNPGSFKLDQKSFYMRTMTAGMLMRYKHESLHIKGWDAKRAIEDTTPHQEITTTAGEDAPERWVVEVMGEYKNSEELNAFALSFLDKPYQEPTPPAVIDVTASNEGEKIETPVPSAIRVEDVT